MDVSAASAVNLYSYQTNLQKSGQSSAVLQALTQAASSNSAFSSQLGATDELASSAGSSSSLGALMGGITKEYTAQGGSFPTADLSARSFGGIQASSASALLGDSGSDTGSQGFSSAQLNSGLAQAIAAYQYQQTNVQAATTQTASQAAQQARSSSLADGLNLLA